MNLLTWNGARVNKCDFVIPILNILMSRTGHYEKILNYPEYC